MLAGAGVPADVAEALLGMYDGLASGRIAREPVPRKKPGVAAHWEPYAERNHVFANAGTDFAPIMSKMLALKPDIICLDTCYADYVHPLTEQAFQQG